MQKVSTSDDSVSHVFNTMLREVKITIHDKKAACRKESWVYAEQRVYVALWKMYSLPIGRKGEFTMNLSGAPNCKISYEILAETENIDGNITYPECCL